MSKEEDPSPLHTKPWYYRPLFLWSWPILKLDPADFKIQSIPPLPLDVQASNAGPALHLAHKRVNLSKSHWAPAWRLAFAYHNAFFYWDYYFAVLYRMLELAASVSEPVILKYFLQFFTNDDSLSVGFFWCTLLALVRYSRVVLINHRWWLSELTGMKILLGTRSAIIKKSLKVHHVSAGNASNLLNIDPYRLAGLTWHIHTLLSFPGTIACAMALLANWVGLSTLVSLLFMFLLVPFGYYTMTLFSTLDVTIMKLKDQRTTALNEVLQGITVVKFFAWEEPMCQKINEIRAKEIAQLRKYDITLALVNFALIVFSTGMALATFATYSLLGHSLTVDVIFPCLTLFESVRWAILFMPSSISAFADAWVSINRVATFFEFEELSKIPIVHDDPVLELKDVSFQHRSIVELEKDGEEKEEDLFSGFDEIGKAPENPFQLKNISISARSGEIVAVIGKIGSGKSSLLQGILGELLLTGGKRDVRGTVSYVSQQSWIQNATLQENVTFGLPFDQSKFDAAVRMCSLQRDLDLLKNREFTEIGEKGINLSGGQKARVTLARAVYADNQIVLLDDPLSAVDAHVGAELWENCIMKLAKDKIVILVTHQTQYLSDCTRICVLEDGEMQQYGEWKQIAEDMRFKALSQSLTSSNELSISNPKERFSSFGASKPEQSQATTVLNQELGRITEDEDQEVGSVSADVYKKYLLKALHNWWLLAGAVALAFTAVFFEYGQTLWLGSWADKKFDDPLHNVTHGLGFYLGAYAGLVGADALLHLSFALTWFLSSLGASQKFHDELLNTVIRAPLSFFFANPTGRIVNRLTRDMYAVDLQLPDNLYDIFQTYSHSVIVCIMVVFMCPYLLLAIIPFGFVCAYFGKLMLPSSRELTRIESVHNSPVFSHYTEILNGLASIRAFAQQKGIQQKMNDLITNPTLAYFYRTATQSCAITLLESIKCIFLFSCSMVIILNRENLSVGLIGVILGLISSSSDSINWGLKVTVTAEGKMSGVERIISMTNIPNEGKWVIDSSKAPSDWPSKGQIEFRDFDMSYSGSQLVLKNINFKILSRQKVGVVGRTGAGKSSLISALFRLIEPRNGKIIIDDLDISQFGLHEVRTRISIIPQDPVLFEGTIRSNLDPFSQFSDPEIWRALERAHLRDFVESQPLKLNHKVEPNGGNLSIGQKQLICIGRTLLSDSQILVMDEATASVDNETDALVQKTVRSEFQNRTVITIAHRLNTIMDSDMIMVLDQGELKEFDSPANLLSNPGSFFSLLVADTGAHNAKNLIKMVKREPQLVLQVEEDFELV